MKITISYLVLLALVLGCIIFNTIIDKNPLLIPASQSTTISEKKGCKINMSDATNYSSKQKVLSGSKLLMAGAFLNVQSLTWRKSLWSYGVLIFIIFVFVYVVRKYELIRIRAKIESEKLKELDKIKTRFYMNITHQFRNPLTVILGMTGELKNNPDEAIKLIEDKMNVKHDVEIVGVELDPSAAENAAKVLDKVLVGSVEDNLEKLRHDNFDVILYGDVLEHLTDPWKVVKEHLGILSKQGCMIASIPNIGYFKVIQMLKQGKWTYQDAGIMDRTHLRFFTRSTMIDLFQQSGMRVRVVGRVWGGNKLLRLFRKRLPAKLSDRYVQQFILRAER